MNCSMIYPGVQEQMELLVTKLKQAEVLFAFGFMTSTLSLCMWLNIQKYL